MLAQTYRRDFRNHAMTTKVMVLLLGIVGGSSHFLNRHKYQFYISARFLTFRFHYQILYTTGCQVSMIYLQDIVYATTNQHLFCAFLILITMPSVLS